MLGIDLVDLGDPLLKERTQDSLRFILHPRDSFSINIPHPFWFLWTAKEAVFKAKRELTSFAPKHIPIVYDQNNNDFPFHSGEIRGHTLMIDQVILSVASVIDLGGIHYDVLQKRTQDPSHDVRIAIQEFIAKHYKERIEVVNDNVGLPILAESNSPVSFSHHGKFIAFSFLRNSLSFHH